MREMSRFWIGAYNCQGLQDYKKRADVFKWLKLDICCLVHTHCKNDAGEEIKWSNQWGYKGVFLVASIVRVGELLSCSIIHFNTNYMHHL